MQRESYRGKIYQYSIETNGIGEVFNIVADSLEEAQSFASEEFGARQAGDTKNILVLRPVQKYSYDDIPPIKYVLNKS